MWSKFPKSCRSDRAPEKKYKSVRPQSACCAWSCPSPKVVGGAVSRVTSLGLTMVGEGLALIPITPRFCSKSTACDQNGRMVAMEPAVSILVLQGSSVVSACQCKPVSLYRSSHRSVRHRPELAAVSFGTA